LLREHPDGRYAKYVESRRLPEIKMALRLKEGQRKHHEIQKTILADFVWNGSGRKSDGRDTPDIDPSSTVKKLNRL